MLFCVTKNSHSWSLPIVALYRNKSMGEILTIDGERANSQINCCGVTSKTSSEKCEILSGKSVDFVSSNSTRQWFPIRATHRRAQSVYEKIVSINDGTFEPYLPLLRRIEYTNDDFDNPTQYIKEEPLDSGLLFLKSTLNDFKQLLTYSSLIPGMTPYYNHFVTNEYGKNDFLTVPDRQMDSFKIIVESGSENIIVNQDEAPDFVSGDLVVVIGGPFAGVEGIVLKYKRQKRVFVQIPGLGNFGTAYVPKDWIRKL